MRVLLHDALTGEFVTELPFTKASWSSGVGRADSVSVSVPGYTDFPAWDYMIPRRYTISPVFDDGYVPASGVSGMVAAGTDRDGLNRVEFGGQGIESIFERIPVLPAAYWPLVNASGVPILARDTYFSGLDYGTIMKRLYQQALSHPGMPSHMFFQPDRVGTRQKGWLATDGKPVQEAVEDVSDLIGGVEWDWLASLDSRENLSFGLLTATDAVQELTSSFRFQWQTGGDDPDVGPVSVKVSPEFFCSTAIFTGGKGGTDGSGAGGDRVMVSRALNNNTILAGVPASFVWDSSHSSVSEQTTLNGWASQRALEGGAPVQFWEFKVRASSAPGLRHGMWADLIVDDHWCIPNGLYSRRIVEVSGEVGESGEPDWLSVVVAGELSW